MAVPNWLFGPAGDLRPLPSPEMDVVNTVQRFGGIHNAINGARTVDVLGHRANYEFEMNFLNPEEYFWVEALYTETIPGPFYLQDPMRKNLYSREAATARPADASGRGIRAYNDASLSWYQVSDSPVSWLKRGVTWSNINVYPESGAGLTIDSNSGIPLLEDTPVSVSVYARSNEAIQVHWTARFYDADMTQISSDPNKPLVTLPANEWVRVTENFTRPTAEALLVLPEFWHEPGGGATDTTNVEFIGFQAEHGNSATDLALGGGSMRAVIDTMDTVSPYYPYQSVSLKILEV